MAWGTKSRQERGYGKEWTKLRLIVLARDFNLCQCKPCQASGNPMLASEVDHIVSKAKARAMRWTDAQIDALSNLQSMNVDCHKRKTQADEGRTLVPKVQIGPDGWPT